MKNRQTWVQIIVVLLIASLPFWFIQTSFILDVATITLIFMSAAIAWNIISGYAGLLSFGHPIFFGIGAYTVVLLFIRLDVSPWLGMLFGGVLSAFVAAIVGYPAFRLRGIYFTLATFALTSIFVILARYFRGFTGGDVGLQLPLLGNSPGNFQFQNELWYYYIALILVVACFLCSQSVYRSRLGFSLRAIRDDEDAAQASGVNVVRAKIWAFMLSAFLTAIAGVMYLQFVGFIDPQSAFGIEVAIVIALPAIAGGLGRMWGPVIGAAVLIPLEQVLTVRLAAFPAELSPMVYAVVIIIIMLSDPQGMLSLGERAIGKVKPLWKRSRAESVEEE